MSNNINEIVESNNTLHLSPVSYEYEEPVIEAWRISQRKKTVSVALVLCLNIGVDPPDSIPGKKGRLECWVDPMDFLSPTKALEEISTKLQRQYERWQPRAQYKYCFDPTVDEVRKLCYTCRKKAKEDRLLFHYNGHGVPRPTKNGELWVFNQHLTKYIPLSLHDLRSWLGVPSIIVIDCSHAGLVVDFFKRLPAAQTDELIILGACGSDEILPTDVDLPADFFTSCLTTPVKTALHVLSLKRHPLLRDLDGKFNVPGNLSDRRTPLGELHWALTTVTDTIAWNVLPFPLFQRLYRQDSLVAGLSRNYILAQRLFNLYGLHPVSFPQISPSVGFHPMWNTWDMTLDLALICNPYIPKPLFEDQLLAFDLSLKSQTGTKLPDIPIIIQMLVSQTQRPRALESLAVFLDKGPKYVMQALCVGICPCILRLLHLKTPELRFSLLVIWSKILSVDRSCQRDLLREQAHEYFIDVLSDMKLPSLERELAAFCIACMADNFDTAKRELMSCELIPLLCEILSSDCTSLYRFSILAMSRIVSNYAHAVNSAILNNAIEILSSIYSRQFENVFPSNVRAAVINALSCFIGYGDDKLITASFIECRDDGSPAVRVELVLGLYKFALLNERHFSSLRKDDTLTYSSKWIPVESELHGSSDKPFRSINIYTRVFQTLVGFKLDPCPLVAQLAGDIVKTFDTKKKLDVPPTYVDPFNVAVREICNNSGIMCDLKHSQGGSNSKNKFAENRNMIIKSFATVNASDLAQSTEIARVATFKKPHVRFHSYAPVFSSISDDGVVNVCDFSCNVLFETHVNSIPTSAEWANEHELNPLLIVGSGDGCVRFYDFSETNVFLHEFPKEVTSESMSDCVGSLRLLTAFTAVKQKGTLLSCWDQGSLSLLISCGRQVRLWDMHLEYPVIDLNIEANASAITLSSPLFCLALSNGNTRLYDIRSSASVPIASNVTDAESVIAVQMISDTNFLSVSKQGIIRKWPEEPSYVQLPSPLISAAFHRSANAFLTASTNTVSIVDCSTLAVINNLYTPTKQIRSICSVSSHSFYPISAVVGPNFLTLLRGKQYLF